MSSTKHQLVPLFVLLTVVIFIGCESTITNENRSDLKSAASQSENGLIPAPIVSHSVVSFNPYLSWNNISGAVEYKVRREICCVKVKTFTVTSATEFQDGEIIHPYLETVDTAVPNEWVQYRVKAILDDGESGWSSWKYFHLPDATQY